MSTHLCPLHGQGKPRPSSRQVTHFEGRSLLGPASHSWVGVVQHDPLRAVLHLRQRYTQVYNLEKVNHRSMLARFTSMTVTFDKQTNKQKKTPSDKHL